jgi:hypothetical protein
MQWRPRRRPCRPKDGRAEKTPGTTKHPVGDRNMTGTWWGRAPVPAAAVDQPAASTWPAAGCVCTARASGRRRVHDRSLRKGQSTPHPPAAPRRGQRTARIARSAATTCPLCEPALSGLCADFVAAAADRASAGTIPMQVKSRVGGPVGCGRGPSAFFEDAPMWPRRPSSSSPAGGDAWPEAHRAQPPRTPAARSCRLSEREKDCAFPPQSGEGKVHPIAHQVKPDGGLRSRSGRPWGS